MDIGEDILKEESASAPALPVISSASVSGWPTSGSNLTANGFAGTDLRPRGPHPNAMTERKPIDSAEFAAADL